MASAQIGKKCAKFTVCVPLTAFQTISDHAEQNGEKWRRLAQLAIEKFAAELAQAEKSPELVGSGDLH